MTDFDAAAAECLDAANRLRELRQDWTNAFLRYRYSEPNTTDRQAIVRADAETGNLITEAEAKYEAARARLWVAAWGNRSTNVAEPSHPIH